jgi:NADH dehydrogenase FAD-containing subunit
MSRPKVVIVGGGFGGLAAARTLKSAPVDVVLLDRSNHHLFQPLLYQVATSVLTPGQIASPIRNILRKQKNVSVVLAEVTGIDKEGRRVIAKNVDREGVAVSYDYLILATGAHHSYFGHEELAQFAPGLKSAADAVMIRNRILQAFERAEAMEDPSRQDGLLTFVLVGAGPTGVEMAGAISVLIRQTLRTEFRRSDPASARVVLVEGGTRILPNFSEPLSQAATKRLESLGVEIRPGHVDRIDETGAWIGNERIPSKTVIWTAGVKASPVGEWLGVETDRSGRVRVDGQVRVPGHPEIFVIGDAASFDNEGHPLPGVAQVALQQGRYVARCIAGSIAGAPQPPPFRYFDKGNMAVVGKGYAVLETGRFRLSGIPAWMAWAAVHIHFLAQESLRLSVFLQWMWTFLTGQRGSRLIVEHHGAAEDRKQGDDPGVRLWRAG